MTTTTKRQRNLRFVRRAKGITARELAAASRISAGDISRLENCRADGHPGWWARLSILLGVPVSELQLEVVDYD